MKRASLVFMVILILAGASFAQTLGNPVKVATVNGGVRWSECAFTPDGILHVCFEENTSGAGHPIWYVKYDGTNISTPINMTGDANIKGERPGIAAGPSGHIVVLWGIDASKSTWMRVYDPVSRTWASPELVKGAYGYGEPNACIDADGNIYAFWSDDNGGRVYSRAKINGAWEEPKRLSAGYGKQGGIAMGSDGWIWAMWREKGANGNYKNYYSKRTKTTAWTSGEIVTASGGSSSHPQITVGPNNVPVIVWGDIDPENENGAEIRLFKIRTGSTREIVIEKYMQHYPRAAVDSAGVIHVACQVGGGDFGSGLRYTNNSGGSWHGVQTVPSAMNKVVGISADPYGNVAACQSAIDNSAGNSQVWVYSLQPVTPRLFYPPTNLQSSIKITSAHRAPQITYNLAWSANALNRADWVKGYNIYVKEGTGAYQFLIQVTKDTLSKAITYTDMTKKRKFAIATVPTGGIVSDRVEF